MRPPFYDVKAPKQTVSLTINSDLYAQAKRLRISASRVAEEAIACAVAKCTAEQIKAEIRQDLEALDGYESEHGSFAEIVREHYQAAGDPLGEDRPAVDPPADDPPGENRPGEDPSAEDPS